MKLFTFMALMLLVGVPRDVISPTLFYVAWVAVIALVLFYSTFKLVLSGKVYMRGGTYRAAFILSLLGFVMIVINGMLYSPFVMGALAAKVTVVFLTVIAVQQLLLSCSLNYKGQGEVVLRRATEIVVLTAALSALYPLAQNLIEFKLGRVGPGVYFSTLYIFGGMVVSAALMRNLQLFPKGIMLVLMLLFFARYFIDLRRGPFVLVIAFLVVEFCLVFFGGGAPKSRRGNILRMKRVIGLSLSLILGVALIYLAADFNSRLKLDSFKRAFFDSRLADYLVALEGIGTDSMVGFGLGYEPQLLVSENVHSLYLSIYLQLGYVGLVPLLISLLIIAWCGYLTREPRVAEAPGSGSPIFDGALARLLQRSAAAYFAFFLFSQRGLEAESFFVLGIVLFSLQYNKVHLQPTDSVPPSSTFLRKS